MNATKSDARECRSRYSRRRRQRRGAIVVFVCITLVLFFAVCAFSVDIGNIITTKTQLMAAADAAALAAAGTMTESPEYDFGAIRTAAMSYALNNVPASYGGVLQQSNVSFGVWDPETRTFALEDEEPNAVRVVLERSQSHSNPVPFMFGRVLGHDTTDVSAEAIAVGAPTTEDSTESNSVYVTSTKDLSNVVLEFDDGEHQKFDDLSGYTATFQGTGENAGKKVVCVWIKSGCNHSNDGPGYGERLDNPGDQTTIHGNNRHRGCRPHVTATFTSVGPIFTDSGALGPVRLVK